MPIMQSQQTTTTALFHFTGDHVVTYILEARPGVLYTIQVQASKASSIKIYASSSPYSDHVFPAIPTDPTIHVTSVTKQSLALKWKPAEKGAFADDSGVHYCIALSPGDSFSSECAARALILGDYGPPLPSHIGFGFKKENLPSMPKKEVTLSSREAHFQCVNDTSVTFKALHPNTHYFYTVFAVMTGTNSSRTYMPGNVTTKSTSYGTIKPRQQKVLQFEEPGEKIVKFRMSRPAKQVSMYFEACGGSFNIYVSSPQINSQLFNVTSSKVVIFNLVPRGIYSISVKTLSFKSKLKAWFTSMKQELPLPEDTKLTVLNSNCSSVTVAWNVVDHPGQIHYCLYRRRLKKQKTNSCTFDEKPRRKKDKVGCFNFENPMPVTGVKMVKVVRNLRAGKKYEVELVARSADSRWFKYKNTVVHTKHICRNKP